MEPRPATDKEINKERPQDQNVDRDGRERQPTEQQQEELRKEDKKPEQKPEKV
jgi:hypothetical protein